MPEMITLALSVYAKNESGSLFDSEYWERTIVSPFLPAPGDRVPLWEYPAEDRGEGELWRVVKRYWRPMTPGGLVLFPVLVLVDMWVDPPEGDRNPDRYDSLGRHPWWTRSAGDPQALLAANGWSNA